MFDGATILVTGGTGSFGKAFVQKIFEKYRPKKVVVFSRDEYKQYKMQQEFERPELRFLIGDVREKDRLLVAMNRVDYLVHAAALKQVPAAEYNPIECIKTNVYGAENVVQAAWSAGVKKVIALSTDKAVNPINLYGATKLASDKLFVAANNMIGDEHPRFSVVRYGNVVGSRGSVVQHFRVLINRGEKSLPITDERMTRFWITIEEGVNFVLKGFERMKGGETFVPKIPSIRIVDLAKAMAPDLSFNIIGRRPGEKLHEVMCPRDDSELVVEYSDHYVIKPTIQFFDKEGDYSYNGLGEKGSSVESEFEYSSETNRHILDVEQIRKNLL